MRPATFRFAESYELDVKQPSGLAYIPELDRFVAIDDSSRTLVVFELTKLKLKADRLDSRPHKKDKISDFEGITYDPERRRLITVSERSRRIRVFRLLAGRRAGKLSGLQQVGDARLPKLGDNPNKGIVGLAFLPGRFAPDRRSHIVAVNEADPEGGPADRSRNAEDRAHAGTAGEMGQGHRRLVRLCARPAVRTSVPAERREPAAARASSLRIKRGALDLAKMRRFDIEGRGTGKIEQPEGIVFDSDGDLYLTSEGSYLVYRYKRR